MWCKDIKKNRPRLLSACLNIAALLNANEYGIRKGPRSSLLHYLIALFHHRFFAHALFLREWRLMWIFISYICVNKGILDRFMFPKLYFALLTVLKITSSYIVHNYRLQGDPVAISSNSACTKKKKNEKNPDTITIALSYHCTIVTSPSLHRSIDPDLHVDGSGPSDSIKEWVFKDTKI